MKFHTVYTAKQKQYNFSFLQRQRLVREGGRLHARLALERTISAANPRLGLPSPLRDPFPFNKVSAKEEAQDHEV